MNSAEWSRQSRQIRQGDPGDETPEGAPPLVDLPIVGKRPRWSDEQGRRLRAEFWSAVTAACESRAFLLEGRPADRRYGGS